MVRFLKSLLLLPVAAVVILLAVANRAPVQLSFDPVNVDAPAFSVSLPLYAILFGAVALGIVVGGVFTWLGQGRARASARHHRREATRYSQLRRFHTVLPVFDICIIGFGYLLLALTVGGLFLILIRDFPIQAIDQKAFHFQPCPMT